MLNTLAITIIFVLVVVLVTCIANACNRKSRVLLQTAKAVVREKLTKRGEYPVEQLLIDCNIPENYRSESLFLIKRIGELLGQTKNKLLPDELLSTILRVKKIEFSPSQYNAWEKEGLLEYIEVFGDDILAIVEKYSVPKKWESAWECKNAPPKNDDEWIDFILSIEFCKFLHFFAPMIDIERI